MQSEPSRPLKPAVTDGDKKFFDQVNKDVDKIILKEKIQEEYRKVCKLGTSGTIRQFKPI